MICKTCGTECGADGIVTECRNNPNVSAVDYRREIGAASLARRLAAAYWRGRLEERGTVDEAELEALSLRDLHLWEASARQWMSMHPKST